MKEWIVQLPYLTLSQIGCSLSAKLVKTLKKKAYLLFVQDAWETLNDTVNQLVVVDLPSNEPFSKADVADNIPLSFWMFAIVSAFSTTSIRPTLWSVEIQP